MKININDFPVDTDDYINKLLREIESLKNIIESLLSSKEMFALKLEVKTQREEIALLREERKTILDSDKPPGWCIR